MSVPGKDQGREMICDACNVRPEFQGEHRCFGTYRVDSFGQLTHGHGREVTCSCPDPLCRLDRGEVSHAELMEGNGSKLRPEGAIPVRSADSYPPRMTSPDPGQQGITDHSCHADCPCQQGRTKCPDLDTVEVFIHADQFEATRSRVAYWAEAHELVDSADALSDAAIADLFNEIRDSVRASLACSPVAGKDRQEDEVQISPNQSKDLDYRRSVPNNEADESPGARWSQEFTDATGIVHVEMSVSEPGGRYPAMVRIDMFELGSILDYDAEELGKLFLEAARVADRKSQAHADQTQAEPVGEAPSPETFVPPVDPEVLDRACEEIAPLFWAQSLDGYGTAQKYVGAIAAAAYRQGREDGIREASELIESRSGFEVTKEHGCERARDGYLINRPSLLDSLRSLLTDKEGEQ